jgi:hypothetical protein
LGQFSPKNQSYDLLIAKPNSNLSKKRHFVAKIFLESVPELYRSGRPVFGRQNRNKAICSAFDSLDLIKDAVAYF